MEYGFDVSIIIVNYNTKQLTIDVINSIIEKTDGINYEIIVVDNGSSDESLITLNQIFGKKVVLIDAGKNLGFGNANNLGLEHAQGQFIFLLNSDTLLVNNAIKILFHFIKNNPDVGICGGNLFDLNGNPNHSFRRQLPSYELKVLVSDIFGALLKKMRVIKRDDFNFSKHAIEVAYITGADMMIRRSALDKCGSFDPDFFMYYEETELCHRFKQNGYSIMSVPEAKIVHFEGASFKGSNLESEFNEKKYRLATESMYKFFVKVNGVQNTRKVYYFKRNVLFCISILKFNNSTIMRKLKVNKEAFKKSVEERLESL